MREPQAELNRVAQAAHQEGDTSVTAFEYRQTVSNPRLVERKPAGAPDGEFQWCGSMHTRELAAEAVEALNGAGTEDVRRTLADALATLDELHARIHAVRALDVPEETKRQASQFLARVSDDVSGT